MNGSSWTSTKSCLRALPDSTRLTGRTWPIAPGAPKSPLITAPSPTGPRVPATAAHSACFALIPLEVNKRLGISRVLVVKISTSPGRVDGDPRPLRIGQKSTSGRNQMRSSTKDRIEGKFDEVKGMRTVWRGAPRLRQRGKVE